MHVTFETVCVNSVCSPLRTKQFVVMGRWLIGARANAALLLACVQAACGLQYGLGPCPSGVVY